MFSDPSHHHAGSTVWYRGRGGGWAVHWSVFLPTSVARAELQYPCTPRGALGESHLEPHAALVRYFILVAVRPKKSSNPAKGYRNLGQWLAGHHTRQI